MSRWCHNKDLFKSIFYDVSKLSIRQTEFATDNFAGHTLRYTQSHICKYDFWVYSTLNDAFKQRQQHCLNKKMNLFFKSLAIVWSGICLSQVVMGLTSVLGTWRQLTLAMHSRWDFIKLGPCMQRVLDTTTNEPLILLQW